MSAGTTLDAPPMTRYLAAGAGSMRFCDAQEQASALMGWNQDYLQLSAGRFQGELCQIQGRGIKLFVEQVQQAVFQTGVLPPNVLAVGLPLHASGSGMFCGRDCGSNDFHVFSGSSGFEFRSSRHHTMLGIELQLDAGWLSDGGPAQPLPRQACALRMTGADRATLKSYLLTLLHAAQANPALLSNAAVVATVADFLLDRMQAIGRLSCAVSDTLTQWKLVQQACARVQETLDQAPTVAQLCVDLGVSRRTLQNGFHQVLDVSPLNYLKAVRLGQARRALKRVGSVTEAATAFGFWHFGHFAHDYQAMFGERPSDTLRRHAP